MRQCDIKNRMATKLIIYILDSNILNNRTIWQDHKNKDLKYIK